MVLWRQPEEERISTRRLAKRLVNHWFIHADFINPVWALTGNVHVRHALSSDSLAAGCM